MQVKELDVFTEKEIAYVKAQRLARIGTVSADSQPDVSPVGFEFDGDFIYIGGMNNEATRKYKNVALGNTQVALSIDDLESVDPWTPRGIRVFGTADIVEWGRSWMSATNLYRWSAVALGAAAIATALFWLLTLPFESFAGAEVSLHPLFTPGQGFHIH
jgi:pyridoxamine 5'-phosphate oxidase family protein